jgi:replicative DNA helicase
MTLPLRRRRETEWVDLPVVHPANVAADQICEALSALDRDVDEFVRWPYPDLDTLTGPLAPGNVWFVCAPSSGGKTTFVASTIEQWWRAGKKVYVMALETRAYEFRTYLACMAQGIAPGEALSGNLLKLPNGPMLREGLKNELRRQIQAPMVERVMVSATRAIDVMGLQHGMMEAKAFGADVVIVDHIDHLESGENGSNLYAAAKDVNHAALRLAQDNDQLLVFTSQLNMQSDRTQDHLAKYAPPRDQHVLFGGLKRQVATGMIGLFRPIRKRRHTETDDDYAKAIRRARCGEDEAWRALEPGVMGVSAMKLRNFGQREGARTYLTVTEGKVEHMRERDKYTTRPGQPGQA